MVYPEDAGGTPAEQRAAMTWAQRLKRVFNIDISVCEQCGVTARVVACIEGPDVIRRILNHLRGVARHSEIVKPGRGPPQLDFLV